MKSFLPLNSAVTVLAGKHLLKGTVISAGQDSAHVAFPDYGSLTAVIKAYEEGRHWARGHGDDVRAKLLLLRSAR